MMEITGKHNYWIKEQLISHYGERIEFKRGRKGGIYIDGEKMNNKD